MNLPPGQPDKKARMRRQLFLLQLSIPLMIASGVVLYRRCMY